MIHPDTYIKETEKGFGVFTKRPFKRGEILWLMDDFDVCIPLQEYKKLDQKSLDKYNVYSYIDSTGMVIVPWDEGKYVNHSCEPNSVALVQADYVSIALKDIAADEEIVEDYDAYYGHFGEFKCLCGAKNCREIINRPDKEIRHGRLDLNEIGKELIQNNQLLLELATPKKINFQFLLNQYNLL